MPSSPTSITHIGTHFDSNAEGTSDSSLTVDVPSGTQNGDLMIMCIYNSQAGSTEEGTWTQLYEIDTTANTRLRARVLYRIASSEPATYTVTRTSGNTWGVAISVFRGVNQSTPINTSANAIHSGLSSPASITAPNVTTTTADCKIFTYLATRSGTTAEATFFSSTDTELADWGFDNGTNPRNGHIYFSGAKSQGLVSGLSMTRNSGSVTDAIAFTLALTPATTYTENPSDTLTINDYPTGVTHDIVHTVNASDTLTLNDTPSSQRVTRTGTTEDTVRLSDSVDAQITQSNDYVKNESDTLSLSDAVSFSRTSVFSDTETLEDSTSFSHSKVFSDAEDLSDSASRLTTLSLSDALDLSDSNEANLVEGVRQYEDTEDLSDSVSFIYSGIRDLEDTSDLSDEVFFSIPEITKSDTVTLSDSVSITHLSPDSTDDIGNFATTLVQGPATIYVADFGATEPEGTQILSEPNAEWTDLGGTLDGVELEVAQEYEGPDFEQVPDLPLRRLKRRRLSAKTVLAEPTLQNILYALNGGTLAAEAEYESYIPADVDEATELTYRAVMLYGWAPGSGQNSKGKRRVVVMRKCLSIDNVELSYKKEDQTGLSVTWGVHRVDDVTPPFLIIDED